MTSVQQPRAVHLVGIGGMALSGIAQILMADGVRVSGSDQTRSAMTEKLTALGADVRYGHDAGHVGDVELVVTTAAAKASNPELLEAARRGIPVISRAAMVARLMAGRVGVAVAGTHGKTTTSSMLTWLLHEAGRDPSFLVGGEVLDLGTNAAPGRGAEIVVEADEYARAFLEYAPRVAVVLNVEADHLEYYGSVASYEDAFRQFLRRVTPDGVIVACADSPRLAALLAEGGYAARVETYGLERPDSGTKEPVPLWLARDAGPDELGGHTFDVLHEGAAFGRFSLRLPGAHNMSNALGAIAAGHMLGLDAGTMRDALARFHGAGRRFELVGEARGVTIVDDFGHHPTEIAATLTAARERFPGRRLVVAFQPHTFSRTSYLFDQFIECFAASDKLIILDTFASRETAEAGMSAEELAKAVISPPCEFAKTAEDAAERLTSDLRSGDVLVTIGAGDIDRVGRAVRERLREP